MKRAAYTTLSRTVIGETIPEIEAEILVRNLQITNSVRTPSDFECFSKL
jgi:hypothetical protein